MKIAVLVKGVPDFNAGSVKFKEDNTLDRGSTPTTLNPNDHLALHAALEAKVKHGGEVVLMTMGPPNYKMIIGRAMNIYGDRGVLLSDRALGGADTLATAETLSAGIRTLGDDVDVVFAGFKSADGETGQTGPQTAWKLGWPIVTHITKLELFPEEKRFRAERIVDHQIEEVEGPLPAVLVTDPSFTGQYTKASHRLKYRDLTEATKKRAENADDLIETWDAPKIGVDVTKVGLKGSPTIVRKVEPIPVAPSERTAEVLDGSKIEDVEKAARIILEKGGML